MHHLVSANCTTRGQRRAFSPTDAFDKDKSLLTEETLAWALSHTDIGWHVQVQLPLYLYMQLQQVP